MNPVLSAKNLSIGYRGTHGDHVLMKGLNLELRPGELVCFMGPNGVGKSTLLRTLSGLQKHLAGELSRIDERNIAVVLTERVTASFMTAAELISYGRYPYLSWSAVLTPEDERIISESMELVHVQHLANKKLYELSDGQMQMVMIARALAQQTPVMLLDEPTAHLDLNNRLEVMKVLRKLTRTTGKAILVATHELDLALQTADTIWLATPEQTVVHGIPEDLVLNGAFDEVFQFKGFDLKTGKVQHEVYREKKVNLTGEGHWYLWTKNALERNGYEVDGGGSELVKVEGGRWAVNGKSFDSLAGVLAELSA
ncbi:MAG: ABC transporter ATP-binding protein [Bacteroidota bacterium]